MTEAMNFDGIRAAYERRTFAMGATTFPGVDAPMRVRVLREHEMDAARIEAIEHVKRSRLDTIVDRDMTLNREVRRQVVWRAFFAAGGPEDEAPPFFPSDKDVRALDEDTVDRLFEVYLDHQAEIASAAVPSDEVLDGAIATALESGDEAVATLLVNLDARGLRALSSRLFARIQAAHG